MGRLSRRSFLAAVATTLTALAGCAAFATDGPPARLGELTLSNLDVASHDVHLLIRRGDDVVGWRTYRLPPAEDPGAVASGFDVDRTVWTAADADAPAPVVSVRVDDSGPVRSADLRDDAGCVQVEVLVRAGGDLQVLSGRSRGSC